MRKSYQSHTQLLANVIDEERTTFQLAEIQKWTNLSEKYATNDKLKEKTKLERQQFYQQEIDRIHSEHVNKTAEIRKQMIADYEQLQIEIELMKAKCMLSAEKFDYNYQVLQKKIIENGLINNQERKRLSKLQDALSKIKGKISDERKKFANYENVLCADIRRFVERIEELENRADRYAKSNDNKVDLRLHRVYFVCTIFGLCF